jgi:hypothetical protein
MTTPAAKGSSATANGPLHTTRAAPRAEQCSARQSLRRMDGAPRGAPWRLSCMHTASCVVQRRVLGADDDLSRGGGRLRLANASCPSNTGALHVKGSPRLQICAEQPESATARCMRMACCRSCSALEVNEQTGNERGSQATGCPSGLEDEAKQRGSSAGRGGGRGCLPFGRRWLSGRRQGETWGVWNISSRTSDDKALGDKNRRICKLTNLAQPAAANALTIVFSKP